MERLISIVLAAYFAILAGAAQAHSEPEAPTEAPVLELEALLAAFGWDFEDAQIRIVKVADGLHVLFGLGGNIAVSSGEDGVLVVDDQFPQLMPKIKKALREFADDDVDVAINTHWHFDHAEGNLTLGKEGTQIIAHKNSREKMLTDNIVNLVIVKYDQKAYPAHGLPDVTFDKAMSYFYNGGEIELLHFGAAHTSGDAAVIFRKQNAVHMGDIFNNTGYPFIDAGNGGHIDGMISFCEKVLAEIDDDTIVIPGHGPVTRAPEMRRYVEILRTTRDRIKAMIDDGMSLEEIVAAEPTAEFNEELGAGAPNVAIYLDRVYASLTK